MGKTSDDKKGFLQAVAAASLEEHGVPHWAIDSMFLGEAVCW